MNLIASEVVAGEGCGMHSKTTFSFLAIAAAVAIQVLPAPAHGVADAMSEAAKNFLVTLDDEQRAAASFKMKDEERINWHFIPRERNGLTMKTMRPDQLEMAILLVQSPLSHKGMTKALTIMSLERVLHELENNSPRRDAGNYFISIFGEPGSKVWGWRFEGHHLSMNYTVADGEVSGTPTFFGGNPGEVKEGPRKGLRVLGAEEDLGRALAKTLTEEQKKVAIVLDNVAPKDILTSAAKKVDPLKPDGLLQSAMDDNQKQRLMHLIKEYIHTHRWSLAEADMKKITDAGIEKVTFAWAGSMKKGDAHYYRVQGPTFLLEYDNVQNEANHPHAVWRDFDGDFGRDLLREHHEAEHK
ncbi:MAG: hypothetical protein ACI8XO_001463 [Verrucomicrobiales bacterium]|jgi:hypothetical protein